MVSSDPVQHHSKVQLDWSPDFSFVRRPAREPPCSPGVPSPRTAPPHRDRPDVIKEEEPRVAAGRAMLPSPPPPVRGRERRRPECLIVDVPGATCPPPPPFPTPETAATPITRDGARSLLLSGLPESEAVRLGRSLNRRESAPATEPASASTIHSEILQLREHLRSLGTAYLGNTSAADILVQAVSLRRNSLPDSPSADSPAMKEEPLEEDTPMDADAKPRTPESPRFGNEISVRARVRPRQPDRRPFVMRRKFNLDELRDTIPDPGRSPSRRSSVANLASPYPCSPGPAGPPSTPLIGRARRRSTSVKHGPLPFSPRGRRAPASAGGKAKSSPRTANLMPIHLEFARSYLPVLAALLLSGHIREGDVLDVPLPHPHAWPQTVAHVYTGRGELSGAVRENILYLGGKV